MLHKSVQILVCSLTDFLLTYLNQHSDAYDPDLKIYQMERALKRK